MPLSETGFASWRSSATRAAAEYHSRPGTRAVPDRRASAVRVESAAILRSEATATCASASRSCSRARASPSTWKLPPEKPNSPGFDIHERVLGARVQLESDGRRGGGNRLGERPVNLRRGAERQRVLRRGRGRVGQERAHPGGGRLLSDRAMGRLDELAERRGITADRRERQRDDPVGRVHDRGEIGDHECTDPDGIRVAAQRRERLVRLESHGGQRRRRERLRARHDDSLHECPAAARGDGRDRGELGEVGGAHRARARDQRIDPAIQQLAIVGGERGA